MKVPTRVAPPPPASASWSSTIFGGNTKDREIISKGSLVKKKPPPRPPPPKFHSSRYEVKSGSHFVNGFLTKSQPRNVNEMSGSLIDWSSPPSSPTSTTRSSSDALSVNSFGSASDSANPSSGSNSNVESGFEDDCDLYGPGPKLAFDPWSPPAPVPAPPAISNKSTSWVTFSPNPNKKLAMPTIIRAKPERPKVPKILEKKLEMNALEEIFQAAHYGTGEVDSDGSEPPSPPMPTGPPPPLPQFCAESTFEESAAKPEKAVALFDYGGVLGDLSFRQGDRLQIVRYIDDNWVEARLDGSATVGTAPLNFMQLERCDPQLVTALYEFGSETWEDLSLRPGDKVRLRGRVNADWLYGEVVGSGRHGQFPATFVDHVPQHLPIYTKSQ